MQLVHPPRLREGDTIGLISPAGPLKDDEAAQQSREAMQKLGYQVKTGEHIAARFDYLAGQDQERADDLNAMLRDDEVKGVFCTRGGYGAGRLLRAIDYEAMRRSPKILSGFSDITTLHCAFMMRAGICTLHAPTIYAAYISQPITPETDSVFRHMLTSSEPLGSYRDAMDCTTMHAMKPGKARGRLVGGNLAVFGGIVGTPYLPAPEGTILFLEDIGEEPYRLDRVMTQLWLSGYLEKVEGIILGHFTDCKSDDPQRGTVEEMLERVLAPVNKPILMGFPAGHEPVNAALPMGCEVELDADGGDVIATEAFAS